jgi:hypothetical protein
MPGYDKKRADCCVSRRAITGLATQTGEFCLEERPMARVRENNRKGNYCSGCQ